MTEAEHVESSTKCHPGAEKRYLDIQPERDMRTLLHSRGHRAKSDMTVQASSPLREGCSPHRPDQGGAAFLWGFGISVVGAGSPGQVMRARVLARSHP